MNKTITATATNYIARDFHSRRRCSVRIIHHVAIVRGIGILIIFIKVSVSDNAHSLELNGLASDRERAHSNFGDACRYQLFNYYYSEKSAFIIYGLLLLFLCTIQTPSREYKSRVVADVNLGIAFMFMEQHQFITISSTITIWDLDLFSFLVHRKAIISLKKHIFDLGFGGSSSMGATLSSSVMKSAFG